MFDADHVTGLASRATLSRRLAMPPAGGQRSLLMCDIVGLKAMNDRDGFSAGDRCLAMAADRVRGSAAGADLVARLGGDELLAVFEGPGASGRAAAAAAALRMPGHPTLRVATAEARPQESSSELIDRLYTATRDS